MRKLFVVLIVLSSYLGILGCIIWEIVKTGNAWYYGAPHSWIPLRFLLVFLAVIILIGIFFHETLDEMLKESDDKQWENIKKKSAFEKKLEKINREKEEDNKNDLE